MTSRFLCWVLVCVLTGVPPVSASFTAFHDTSDTAGFTVFPGQLAKVTDKEGVERYSYDVRGRTLKVARTLTVNSTTYTNEFLHDPADRQISVAYPASGHSVTNRCDLGGNLTQVQGVGPGGNTLYFQSRGYTALGELLGPTSATARRSTTGISRRPGGSRILPAR